MSYMLRYVLGGASCKVDDTGNHPLFVGSSEATIDRGHSSVWACLYGLAMRRGGGEGERMKSTDTGRYRGSTDPTDTLQGIRGS